MLHQQCLNISVSEDDPMSRLRSFWCAKLLVLRSFKKALLETEDAVYRTWLLWNWAELNGAGKLSEGRDLLTASVAEVRLVPGLLGSDSRGGYDSIMINESPLLRLSNIRAALRAEQLKQSLPDCGTKLIWLASAWNVSDGLTKKKPERRENLAYFMCHRRWMLKFDPEFIVSSKKQKAVSGSPAKQLSQISKNSEYFGSMQQFSEFPWSFVQLVSSCQVCMCRCHLRPKGPLTIVAL